MSTAEILEKALERLGHEGENWCKHRYHDNGRHCMQGAVHLVASGDGISQAKCWEVLIKVLPEAEGNPIARWNDEPERTFPEVKEAFRKAIEQSKLAGTDV